MKRVLLGGVLRRSAFAATAALVLGSILSAVPAQAAPSTPKILVHLMSTTSKNACSRSTMITNCDNAVTNGLSAGDGSALYYMYLLVATGPLRGADLGGSDEGVGGLTCGITYNGAAGQGVEVFGWTLCATLEFASTGWPASGGGNLITWDRTVVCQKGEIAVAGYFYMAAYSDDTFQVVNRFVDNKAQVAKCSAEEITMSPDDLGSARFTAGGTDTGTNPCLIVPVEKTTWSSIKRSYQNN